MAWYPIPSDETERLATLRRYMILDSGTDPAFDRIVNLASHQFGVPTALVSLIDSERQWFKATCGLDADETGRDVSFCTHALMGDEIMVVPDATRDPRFKNNPFVLEGLKIRFYAGAPLIVPEGHAIGTLCIIDDLPRPCFCREDRALLRALSDVVVDLIVARSQLLDAQTLAAAVELSHDVAEAAS